MNEEVIKLFFPEELLEMFEIVSFKKSEDEYVFFLDEKLNHPEGYSREELESKGFYDEVTVSDFPLRGKPRKYKIRRRKWLVKQKGKIISKKYKIYASGTRKTEEFAAFLKGLDRFYSH